MSETKLELESVQLESAKLITFMLPDDGTDIKIMRQLKNEKGIIRAESVACRGVHNLQTVKTRSGKLPEATFYRMLSVIVSEQQADEVFDFIYDSAHMDQPGSSVLLQISLSGATAYFMPSDVSDEYNSHA